MCRENIEFLEVLRTSSNDCDKKYFCPDSDYITSNECDKMKRYTKIFREEIERRKSKDDILTFAIQVHNIATRYIDKNFDELDFDIRKAEYVANIVKELKVYLMKNMKTLNKRFELDRQNKERVIRFFSSMQNSLKKDYASNIYLIDEILSYCHSIIELYLKEEQLISRR